MKKARMPRHNTIEKLLDQRLFILDAEQHDTVVKVLQNPPAPTAILKKLLAK